MNFVPEEIRGSAIRQIRLLPQADVVLDLSGQDIIDQWIEETYKADPDRLSWHIQKAGYFSGHEISVAAMELSGGMDSIESLREVISRKLFLKSPPKPNAAMEIGSALESVVKKAFHHKFASFGCKTDIAALQKFNEVNSSSRYPWAQGIPDDVVLINNKRFIINYSVTTSEADIYAHGEIPLRHVFNLHLSKLIAQEKNIVIDGLIMSPYIRDSDGFFNLKNFNVKVDHNIEDQIINAGNYCHKVLMKGKLPDYPKKESIPETDSAVNQRLTAYAHQYASYEAIASNAYKNAAHYKNLLLNAMSQYSLNEGDIDLASLVNINVEKQIDKNKVVQELGMLAKAASVKGNLDQKKLIDFLENMKIDTNQFFEPDYDPVILQQLLKESGKSGNFFLKENLKVNLLRSSNTFSPLIGEVRKKAADIVEKGHKDLLNFTMPNSQWSGMVKKAEVKNQTVPNSRM